MSFATLTIGGSRGRRRRAPTPPPPTGSISFVFAHVFAEKCTRRRLAAPPPTGNPGSTTVDPLCYLWEFMDLTIKTKRWSKQSVKLRPKCILLVSAMTPTVLCTQSLDVLLCGYLVVCGEPGMWSFGNVFLPLFSFSGIFSSTLGIFKF